MQAKRATITLNDPGLSKYISVNTQKPIFYSGIENILSYGWEIWTWITGSGKITLKYKNGFLGKSCKELHTVTSKKWSHKRIYGVNINNFARTGKHF
jgi:hypothetical protein